METWDAMLMIITMGAIYIKAWLLTIGSIWIIDWSVNWKKYWHTMAWVYIITIIPFSLGATILMLSK